MRKLTSLAAAVAMVAVFGFAGTAQADPYADVVDTFVLPPAPPNDDCLIAGGDCDTTLDDDDQGGDALAAPDNDEAGHGGGSSGVSTYTSLGFDNTTLVGGILTLNFTDNLCFNGPDEDIQIFEVSHSEDYDVDIGIAGGTLTNIGDDVDGDAELESSIPVFNQVRLEAESGGAAGTDGPDIDAVECFYTLDVADIEKAFATSSGTTTDDTGNDDDIFIGIDEEQHKAFTIKITNNTGIDDAFAGLTFMDTVPAEFDIVNISVDNVTFADDEGECSAGSVEHQSNSKSGKEQLKPDFITIDASGLEAGQACVITVEVVTDLKKGGTRPGRGNSPNYTPTSCPLGGVILNDGVKVIDDSSGAIIFYDDDTLALDCD